MELSVRFGPGLAQAAGSARLQVSVADGATLGDLLRVLQDEHPGLGEKLPAAVAVVGGRHTGSAERLQPGQEVAILMPVAGG